MYMHTYMCIYTHTYTYVFMYTIDVNMWISYTCEGQCYALVGPSSGSASR